MATKQTGDAAPKTADVKLLTKMSISTMRCNPSACKTVGKEGEGGEVPLARLVGKAGGIVEKVGKNGDAVYGLTGTFRGINLQNGKVFTSAVLYLPGGVQEMILLPLDNALTGTEENPGDPTSSIEFGFDVFSYPAANPIGYSYSARDLFPAKRIDPLAALMSALEDIPLPQLEAA